LLFIGAYSSALRILKHSLKNLLKEQDSLNYQLAEINLAHLYLITDYKSEFEIIVNKLNNSPYPEIKVALEYLLQKENPIDKIKISEGWLWRLKRKLSTMEKLSEMEDRLLGYLALRQRTKDELMYSLWNKSLDSEILNSRLKRVLARLKKKRPYLITFTEPNYRLSMDVENPYLHLRQNLPNPQEQLAKINLSGDELKMSLLLQKSPLNFYELMENIYQVKSHSACNIATSGIEIQINRLKNLISRLRKKHPNRLHFREGKYYWI
jgi:hypothetical protein